MSSKVQIPFDVFLLLCDYFCLDVRGPEREEAIRAALEEKLETLVRRDAYTKAKSSPDASERARAWAEYLKHKGGSFL